MGLSKIAVLGDVHGNLHALHAVLADAHTRGVQAWVCVGDIVGYGSQPAECLKEVRSLTSLIVQGNHDHEASSDHSLDDLRDVARAGIEHARRILTAEDRSFLRGLPLSLEFENLTFVHGALNHPEFWPYVLTAGDAVRHFEEQDGVICFCGHTHSPRVWAWRSPKKLAAFPGVETLTLSGASRFLVNVGSVGQPRDGNPDACYVLFTPETAQTEFRRVPYDVKGAQRGIRRAGLPHFLAQRLALGR